MITDLLNEHDTQARQRAVSLEATGKLPAGYVKQHYPLTTHEQRELQRLKNAGAAATDADTYVALARGRTVHESRLNPLMVAYVTRDG